MVKSFLGKNRFEHSEPLFKKYEILKTKDVYIERSLSTMCKARNHLGPSILEDIFIWNEEDSRHRYEMKLLKNTAKMNYTLPTYFLPELWNTMLKQTERKLYIHNNELYYTPKAYSKGIRYLLLQKYYEHCKLKNCYYCFKST